jgi:hypothetical protein
MTAALADARRPALRGAGGEPVGSAYAAMAAGFQ